MVVIFMEQNRFLTMTPSNQIQFTMSLNNIFLQFMLLMSASDFSFKFFIIKEILQVRCLFYTFFLSLSYWLCAGLCALYCVTVVSCKNRLITRLKMRLPVLVPKLLLVTALGCFSISVPSIWYLNIVPQPDVTRNLTTNNIPNSQVMFHDYLHYEVFLIALGGIVPLIISITCLLITVTSLLRHVWRIKLNATNMSDPQLDAHYRACKTMVMLATVFVVLIMAQLTYLTLTAANVSLEMMIVHCLGQLFPTELSVILILSSCKLKKALCRIVPCIK
ncbi:taste receptor type 2 member 40-like [Bombina bombina]|uniref:taste receptor type 2 member 40-like n=1 Tax=Bombina bombina TaxID=8345 RepID=UPI00235ADDA7|nr:taste receptor type 2 member 40-like [Bombina bombina]